MFDPMQISKEIDALVAELETSTDGVGDSLVHLKESATANAVIAVDSVGVLADSVEHLRESIAAPSPGLRSAAGT